MKENIYYIYKITNKINFKCYIGYSKNPYQRWSKHKKLADKYKNDKFHDALRKYSWSNFNKEIIYCSKEGEHTLRVMEPYFIEYYNSFINGYNMTKGGEGILDYMHTEKTKKEMSLNRTGEKNSFFGKRHTQKFKDEMSEKMKKLRPLRIGEKAPNYGKTRSERCKRQVSNKLSKNYLITFPDGHKEEIKGLKKFCKNHNIFVSNILQQKQTKGYSAQKISLGT